LWKTIESEEEGDEESHRDEEDSEPEWGNDSFDGREYHSSDQMGYSDKEFDEKCRYYRRQVILTRYSRVENDSFGFSCMLLLITYLWFV